MSEPAKNRSRLRSWITLFLALIILIPSVFGFGTKFLEFVALYSSDSQEGRFAIAPIVNYLLASLGFLMLLFWATINGMFHDIEGPKYSFMEREKKLDDTIDY